MPSTPYKHDPRINVTSYPDRKHTIREAIALIWRLATRTEA